MYSKDGGSNWTTQTSTSTTNSYTFSGLTSNTAYSIRVKVVDNNNRESSVYNVSVTTDYVNPIVSISTTQTANSITVNASVTKGSSNIAKYMYSKDGGSTWVTNTSTSITNSYTFNNLFSKTSYSIKVKVVDSSSKESTAVSKSVTTSASTTTLAAKVKSLYTSQGSNGIYYHTSSLANGAGDNSYRYAGANPNNYVCFGSTTSTCPSKNLYRIIGVFGNQVKLIHATYATTVELGSEAHSENNYFYWGGSLSNRDTTWSKSTLNTNSLNGTFLTNLGTTWTNKIATTTWNVGGGTNDNLQYSNAKTTYDYEVGANKSSTTYSAKIGLPYISEYYYAAAPTYWTYPGLDSTESFNDYRKSRDNNWMNGGQFYWTISPTPDFPGCVFYVFSVGYLGYYSLNHSTRVRPTFNLISSVKTSGGTGTQADPYRIEL